MGNLGVPRRCWASGTIDMSGETQYRKYLDEEVLKNSLAQGWALWKPEPHYCERHGCWTEDQEEEEVRAHCHCCSQCLDEAEKFTLWSRTIWNMTHTAQIPHYMKEEW